MVYDIHIRKLTIKDMATLQNSGETGLVSILPILNKVVTTSDGTLAEELPYEELEGIVEAIVSRLTKKDPTLSRS